MFTVDIVVLIFLIGIVSKISKIEEFLTWLVGFTYLLVRIYYHLMRALSFIGKNAEWIKKGKKEFFELIKKPE